MADPAADRAAADRPVRERVLDATASITVEDGWGAVTMAKVAGLAGVSRHRATKNTVCCRPRPTGPS